MSWQSSGGRDRRSGSPRWDEPSAQQEEDGSDQQDSLFETQLFWPGQLRSLHQQQIQADAVDTDSIRGGALSPQSRLAGYITRSSPFNPILRSFPQSNPTAGGQCYPISQTYSAGEMTQPRQEENFAARGRSSSPQSPLQYNTTLFPSTQRSPSQQVLKWGGNPSPPTTLLRPQRHQILQSSKNSFSLDATRPSNITSGERSTYHSQFLQPVRTSEFTQGSFIDKDLPSPTQSDYSITLERSRSFDASQSSSTQSIVPSHGGPKAPLPQNLRGDPFRSAKVKTEICRYFNSPKGCIFGDKCNYAHGEQELKFNKLIDLETAQLIDVEVFRTHPCFTWVATGACPFDQRCTRLHDPRVNGSHPLWLPHAEVLITNVGRGLNVDKMYHQQFSAIYSCSPVYGFSPEKRWLADESSTREAFKEFYSYCCDAFSHQPHSTSRQFLLQTESSSSFSPTSSIATPNLSEIHRLEIALRMRERRKAQFYTYLPSHQFCGELCMILQTCYYKLPEDFQNNEIYQILEISEEEASKSRESSGVITAREIAFGPVADASVRPVAVWFNIPDEDITPCTRQQARRHKRSRHRLRQKRNTDQPDDIKILASCSVPPFNCHQPVDDATFDLITHIQTHRYRMLKHLSCSADEAELRSLVLEEEKLIKCFESQRRFWATWTWPKRTGSNFIDDNTDVPDVDGAYSFVTYGNRAFGEDAIFFGKDHRGEQIISEKSKLATGLVWKSFVMNLQLISDRGAVEVSSEEAQMPDHDFIIPQMRRIRTFRNLSLGRTAVRNSSRTPPRLTPQRNSSTPASMTLDGLIREWTALQHEWEENSSNPLRESQMDKHKLPDPDQRRSLSYPFEDAAKSWTRSLPEYSAL